MVVTKKEIDKAVKILDKVLRELKK